MKNVKYTTSRVTICVLNVNICGTVIAYLEKIANLEILPYLLHFYESK